MTSNATKVGAASMDGIFAGLSFFVMQRIPMRAHFCTKIQENGGRIVRMEKQADHIIADHVRNDGPAGSVSYKFIEQATKDGRIPDVEDFRAGPETARIRATGSVVPGKSTRTPFTQQDDNILLEHIEAAKARGESLRGNKIYYDLELEHLHHTMQSWRSRYIKVLADRQQSENRVAVQANAPPSPPHAPDMLPRRNAENDEEVDEESERATKRRRVDREIPSVIIERTGQEEVQDEMQEEVDTEEAEEVAQEEEEKIEEEDHNDEELEENSEEEDQEEADFTLEEEEQLLQQAADIENVAAESVEQAWMAYAEAYGAHGADEWREFYETTIRPRYLEQLKQAVNEDEAEMDAASQDDAAESEIEEEPTPSRNRIKPVQSSHLGDDVPSQISSLSAPDLLVEADDSPTRLAYIDFLRNVTKPDLNPEGNDGDAGPGSVDDAPEDHEDLIGEVLQNDIEDSQSILSQVDPSQDGSQAEPDYHDGPWVSSRSTDDVLTVHVPLPEPDEEDDQVGGEEEEDDDDDNVATETIHGRMDQVGAGQIFSDDVDLSMVEPDDGFLVDSPIKANAIKHTITYLGDDEVQDNEASLPGSEVYDEDEVTLVAEPSILNKGRKMALETQDIFNGKTQVLDFAMPLPDDASLQDESQQEIEFEADPTSPDHDTTPRYETQSIRPYHPPSDLASSSPPPIATTPQKPPPQSKPTPTKKSPSPTDLNTWYTSMVVRSFPETSIIAALKRTTMDPALAEYVLLSEKYGTKDDLTNMPGVWTAEDDAGVESGDRKTLERLDRKHGWDRCRQRMEYLGTLRELMDLESLRELVDGEEEDEMPSVKW